MMSARVLISIGVVDLESTTGPGLDLKTISYLGGLHILVTADSLDATLSLLRQHDEYICCDVTSLRDLQKIISLLDNGASKVIVTYSQMKSLTQDGLLEDFGRLVVSLDHEFSSGETVKPSGSDVEAIVSKTSLGVYSCDVSKWEVLESFARLGCLTRILMQESKDLQVYKRTVKGGCIPVVPAKSLTTESESKTQLIPICQLITSVLQSDRPDGLYPTVVSDERDICLGLVYSNNESIETALRKGAGVYHSRSRHGLWIKGAESGDTQELISIDWDCDADALRFRVRQEGNGFCHLKSASCFGPYTGLSRLEQTIQSRKILSTVGSYTSRLFKDADLLDAKIMEEASELCEARSKKEVAAEAADLFYFALTKCIAMNVSLEDVERNLDRKSLKTTRRKGDAKPQWSQKLGMNGSVGGLHDSTNANLKETSEEAASVPKGEHDPAGIKDGRIQMKRLHASKTDPKTMEIALQRPSQRSTDDIMKIVNPIIKEIQAGGDTAVLKYTHKFEKATSLKSPVLRAPFPRNLMQLSVETIRAIDISYENIRRFHAAQKEEKPLFVETMPGVTCSRFSRPIERVGLYVPGGTAVLPSTALMLGVPAMVAGCKKIVMASPPRSDGTITPEIVYIAHKVGAESIILAGGAQAVAAMAYGTESITKVDKILGPGNQFVTAAKMIVSNDTTAGVSIDMPAGPSEVLVIADKTANPSFVASDLLSQAEHGTDSQVVLIAVGLDAAQLQAIEDALHVQANALPRVDIVRGAIKHSVTLVVDNIEEAMALSNQYAPEHLILQVHNAETVMELVENAGSVFVGPWTPESVGDYSAGVNHSLPTYGYAKQYSGVNLSSFTKHITSSSLTREGLRNVSGAVMQLAKVEELEAHRRAVSIRLEQMESMA